MKGQQQSRQQAPICETPSCLHPAFHHQMRVWYSNQISEQAIANIAEGFTRQGQILIAMSDVSPAVAADHRASQPRLAVDVAGVDRHQSAVGFERRTSERKEPPGLAIVEMMHDAERQHRVELRLPGERGLGDAAVEECSPVSKTAPVRADVGGAGIEADVVDSRHIASTSPGPQPISRIRSSACGRRTALHKAAPRAAAGDRRRKAPIRRSDVQHSARIDVRRATYPKSKIERSLRLAAGGYAAT